LVHEGSDGTEQENNYYQVKETTMGNAIINMNLTPQEALIIENIRAMNHIAVSNSSKVWSEEDHKDALMQKYVDMDDYDFIHKYAEAVGDDVILSVLQDSLGAARKWEIIFDAIDEDVIDHLFEAYVSFEDRRQIFLDSQDRTELCSQLVDMVMDGDWTPEN
jgi:hypothetical protein